MSTLRAGQQKEDLTRKQRREQARTERREIEQAQAAATARRTRLTLLGIVVAVVVAGIVVVLIASAGGGEKHIKPGSAEARPPAPKSPRCSPASRRTATCSAADGAGHAPVLRRPRVPGLQGVHGRSAALGHREVGAQRRAEGRIPLTGDRHARTGSVQSPAGRGARRGQAEQAVELRRDLLPRAAGRGHRLRHRKLHPGHRQTGTRAESRRVDERARRTRRWPKPLQATRRRRTATASAEHPRSCSDAPGARSHSSNRARSPNPARSTQRSKSSSTARPGKRTTMSARALRITLIVLTMRRPRHRRLPHLHPLRRHQAGVHRGGQLREGPDLGVFRARGRARGADRPARLCRDPRAAARARRARRPGSRRWR